MRDKPSRQIADIYRRDFTAFNHRAFRALNGDAAYLGNWHIEVMAAKLEALREGQIMRLIVNLPPRHLKSHTASVSFVAWALGHNPALQILCASYAQDLSDKLARDCRQLMLSPFYNALFATRLSPERQAVGEFVTTKGGFRLSTSVGGVLTGRGADLIVVDDPLKANEAYSEPRRKAVNEWFDTALYSRLNDKKHGAIVIVMQRLHEDDLVGHAMEKEEWEVLSFPAVAEEPERFGIETPYGPRSFTRKPGDILHPQRESRATLEQQKRRMGTPAFAAQYQQAPVPREGAMVKTRWFARYAPDELPKEFDTRILSCDTANKASELADYSALTMWGVRSRHAYLLAVLRRRMEYPELKRAIVDLARLHNATAVLIEDRASGTQLLQELKLEGIAVKACAPVGDKQMRLWAQTATMEQGMVHLPQDAPWLDAYLAELTSFPNSRHDDQVDSTSQALAYIGASRSLLVESIEEWMRKQKEAQEK